MAHGDVGQRVGPIGRCGGRCHLGIAGIPQFQGDPANPRLTFAPLAVAIQVLKDHAGDLPFHKVCEVCGRGTVCPDIEGDRVGRDAGVSIRVGLLNRVGGPCRDVGKRI